MNVLSRTGWSNRHDSLGGDWTRLGGKNRQRANMWGHCRVCHNFCESVCAVSVNEYSSNGILFDFGLRRRGKIFDFAEFAGAQSPEVRAQ